MCQVPAYRCDFCFTEGHTNDGGVSGHVRVVCDSAGEIAAIADSRREYELASTE